MVAFLASGQLNGGKIDVFSLSPFAHENLVPRERLGHTVPRQPADPPHPD